MVSFQVSADDANRLSKEFITQYNGEIVNVPSDELLSLKVGQAYCKVGQHSFFMQTYLADRTPDNNKAGHVVSRSRRRYGATQNEPVEPYREKGRFEDVDPSKVF